MINFLDCLNQIQQIMEHVSAIQLPHRIKERGKLQDPDGQIYSIKYDFIDYLFKIEFTYYVT